VKYEIMESLKTLENDGFIKYMPDDIKIRVEFKPLVDTYGVDKTEYFSMLLNAFMKYLVTKEGYIVEGGVVGLGVSYHLKRNKAKG